MKRSMTYMLIVLALCASCNPTKKEQLYNKFKREIVKDVFNDFDAYLPGSYEESLMAQIRYAPNYNAFGLSGIAVLYDLENPDFVRNVKKLHDSNLMPSGIFDDTMSFNSSHPEYYSIVYNELKVAFPRVSNDFCQVNDTCFSWDDLEMVVLDVGAKKVFTKNIDSEYKPDNLNCKYSIGAFISEKKKHIIYWLFIYN